MDILIPENITGKALDELSNQYSIVRENNLWNNPKRFAELAKRAKAILVRNQTMVDKKIIENADSLMVIGRAGVGYDNIDVEFASKKGIVVCYTPDGNTISTAELAITLMMSLSRKIPSCDKTTKEGKWDRFNHMGVELYNKTLGIVGFGKIGKTVAARAKAFGMKVLVNDKYLNSENSKELNYEVKSFEELLSLSDIITVHLPLNKETKYLFCQRTLSLMKPGSILINTARGGIINEIDLIAALESGQLKGAGLDVREKEPSVKTRLDEFDNVILTPHIGGFTTESQERVVTSIAHDIDLVLKTLPAINYINFPLPKIKTFSND